MKITSAITICLIAVTSLYSGANINHPTTVNESNTALVATAASDDFEKAVTLIKKYEGLHQPKHWPLIGYGHRVLPGEKYSRNRALSEKEADALLRKDLLKNCAAFRQFGADSLILGVLAYNIGSGAAMRSSVTKKLKAGNRDIYDSYVAHSRYRGKTNTQIKKRRIEEFETLFIKDVRSHELPEQQTTLQENYGEESTQPLRRISNLYTPAMQYPLEATPILSAAGTRVLAANRNGAKNDKNKKANHNRQTACILRSQQYYWL